MTASAVGRSKIPLAQYILGRLKQHGCSHLHGVPGDYSLPFLSHLADSKVRWVGNCNELNAGYAADSYGRITGLGALCTTFGVGELSALNAVAGSRAERVPVVHIVGMPSTSALRRWTQDDAGVQGHEDGLGNLFHHSLGRGSSMNDFAVVAQRVMWTTSGGRLRSIDLIPKPTTMGLVNPQALFDSMLQSALAHRHPIRFGLPSDLSSVLVEPFDSDQLLLSRKTVSNGSEDVLRKREFTKTKLIREMADQVIRAERPVIIVDGLASRFGQNEIINKLVASTGIPTVCTPHGLGIVDSDHTNYYGVYTGPLGNQDLHEYVQSSDLVLIFGELFSDTNTVGWTAIPPTDAARANFFGQYIVRHGGVDYKVDTPVPDMVEALIAKVEEEKSRNCALNEKERKFLNIPAEQILPKALPALTDTESVALSQDYVYPRLSTWLKPHDTVILANGTPLIGASLLSLPQHTRVYASGLWFSVGQMLPAAQGAALAIQTLPKHLQGRTILLEGDGGFQATAQELSTIIRYKLDVTIFLFNNKGYAYERLIQGPNADYNDVNDWEYTLAPALMGGRKYIDGAKGSDSDYKIFTRKISTTGELDEVLADPDFNSPHGLKLVELQMGELDVPSYFAPALEAAGKRLTEMAPPPPIAEDQERTQQSSAPSPQHGIGFKNLGEAPSSEDSFASKATSPISPKEEGPLRIVKYGLNFDDAQLINKPPKNKANRPKLSLGLLDMEAAQQSTTADRESTDSETAPPPPAPEGSAESSEEEGFVRKVYAAKSAYVPIRKYNARSDSDFEKK